MLSCILLTSCLGTKNTIDVKEEINSETSTDSSNGSLTKSDAKTIKISNGAGADLPSVLAQIEMYKDLIEVGTEGRYKIEVYHSAQIGDDTKGSEAVRAGSVEMVCPVPSPLVGLCKELALFDLPYLFTSYEEADYILDGEIGQKLGKKIDEIGGFKFIAWWELGFRDLNTNKKPVRSPSDLKGLKIRTMDNKYHLKAWELMGANPLVMSSTEIFTSLQQNVIDGQENPITTINSMQWHTVAPYITRTDHIYSPLLLLMSEKVWNTISPEDQKVFIEAGKETAKYERDLNRRLEQECIEKMAKDGTEVISLTIEEKEKFKELCMPVWDIIAKDIGEDLVNELKIESNAFKAKNQ